MTEAEKLEIRLETLNREINRLVEQRDALLTERVQLGQLRLEVVPS